MLSNAGRIGNLPRTYNLCRGGIEGKVLSGKGRTKIPASPITHCFERPDKPLQSKRRLEMYDINRKDLSTNPIIEDIVDEIVDDIEMKHHDKYYGENFWCPNCGKRNYKYIKKGILLKDVTFICYHCGCEVKGVCYHG